MKFMDKLPTVATCCYCCFLRAGCVLIAMTSFTSGLLLAPNIAHAQGYWDMNPVLSNYNSYIEITVQMVLGIISVFLCFVSCLLTVGSCCSVPILIELYQWGVIIYSSTVLLMFAILSCFCFFVHTNCYLGGGVLCILMALLIMISTYFIIVTNSLRLKIKMMEVNESML